MWYVQQGRLEVLIKWLSCCLIVGVDCYWGWSWSLQYSLIKIVVIEILILIIDVLMVQRGV